MQQANYGNSEILGEEKQVVVMKQQPHKCSRGVMATSRQAEAWVHWGDLERG